MRAKGINDNLVRRMEEVYAETRCEMKGNDKVGNCFWTNKRLRQGCLQSPSLFAAYASDVAEVLRRAQIGGAVAGKVEVWTLVYEDEVTMVETEEKEMKRIIEQLERYVRKKDLKVNEEKTKIMIIKKGTIR